MGAIEPVSICAIAEVKETIGRLVQAAIVEVERLKSIPIHGSRVREEGLLVVKSLGGVLEIQPVALDWLAEIDSQALECLNGLRSRIRQPKTIKEGCVGTSGIV